MTTRASSARCGGVPAHGGTDAFRKAGRERSSRDTVLATTLAPCRYRSRLIVRLASGRWRVGETRAFEGGLAWLRARGLETIDLESEACRRMLAGFIAAHPEVGHEELRRE